MSFPNFDTNQFVPTSVTLKEIDRAEKTSLINAINEINNRLESERKERIDSEINLEKKNKKRFIVNTIVGIGSAIAAIVAAIAAIIAII